VNHFSSHGLYDLFQLFRFLKEKKTDRDRRKNYKTEGRINLQKFAVHQHNHLSIKNNGHSTFRKFSFEKHLSA
jgi:hypothetical protein